MEPFIQASAVTLVAVVLCLTLGKQGKDMSVLLVIAVCCMVLGLAAAYLKPVLDFLRELEKIGGLSGEMTGILFKVAGIGLIAEIAAMICSDAGNASLGKALQLLSSAVILWLSIPIFTALIDLIRGILEEV